ncbi:MAG: hypothetical protein E7624_00755 [Ruminococcaceae bacterium]|nr:hypothetical protein [Oscillospiraceae bacterium]
MCNIAGYVGERDAAPILIEMIKEQEGFNGGFYTGIATLHEGKIYYAKLTGDTDRLLALTEAAKLPGSIGVIHSRTKSGGGDEWAHPFLAFRDGVPFCAYVANGNAGCYRNRQAEYNEMSQQLFEEGYPLPSRIQIDPPAYTQLKDGTSVHMSDVMCQLIARQLKSEADYATAMANAFCEMPGEIVGLLLSLDTPDRITYSRFNMPMSVAFAAHGAYLASSPLAFPADAGEHSILPANSGGYVLCDRFTAIPMKTPPKPVAPLTPEIRIKAYHAVKKALEQQEMIYADVSREVIKPLFESDGPCPVAALTYETLLALKTQGLLKERLDTIEGAFPDLTAPKVKLWI